MVEQYETKVQTVGARHACDIFSCQYCFPTVFFFSKHLQRNHQSLQVTVSLSYLKQRSGTRNKPIMEITRQGWPSFHDKEATASPFPGDLAGACHLV